MIRMVCCTYKIVGVLACCYIVLFSNYAVSSNYQLDKAGRTSNIGELNYPDINCNSDEAMCVSSKEEFINALKSSVKNIVIVKGVYDFGFVEISRGVNIISDEIGKAIFVGESYFSIKTSDVKIQGLRFFEGASPSGGKYKSERYGAISVHGERVLLIDNYFESIGLKSTVADKTGIAINVKDSKNIVIKNNIFVKSRSIAIKTDDYSSNIKVIHNEFRDSVDFGGAGEVVHFGDANSTGQGVSPVDDDTFNYFEYNYIENWNLEKELISIKSNRNVIQNNLVINSAFSAIVIRMGNDNTVKDNVMINNESFPVRISGERNLIKGNLFCGRGLTLSLHAQMRYEKVTKNLYNSYWAAVNNIVVENKYYGYKGLYIEDHGYAADSDVYISSPKGNIISRNNYYAVSDFKADSDAVHLEDNIFNELDKICPYTSSDIRKHTSY